jgi:hypothetical protein
VDYMDTNGIVIQIHSSENLPYAVTVPVSKYSRNIIYVAHMQGTYKVCILPYILKTELYLLRGHIFLDMVWSLLVMSLFFPKSNLQYRVPETHTIRSTTNGSR